MATRKKSAARKARAPRSAGVAARLPKLDDVKAAAARRKFVEGLVKRGEAVPAGKDLPSGATHEIVGKHEDGAPMVKRRRFSAR